MRSTVLLAQALALGALAAPPSLPDVLNSRIRLVKSINRRTEAPLNDAVLAPEAVLGNDQDMPDKEADIIVPFGELAPNNQIPTDVSAPLGDLASGAEGGEDFVTSSKDDLLDEDVVIKETDVTISVGESISKKELRNRILQAIYDFKALGRANDLSSDVEDEKLAKSKDIEKLVTELNSPLSGDDFDVEPSVDELVRIVAEENDEIDNDRFDDNDEEDYEREGTTGALDDDLVDYKRPSSKEFNDDKYDEFGTDSASDFVGERFNGFEKPDFSSDRFDEKDREDRSDLDSGALNRGYRNYERPSYSSNDEDEDGLDISEPEREIRVYGEKDEDEVDILEPEREIIVYGDDDCPNCKKPDYYSDDYDSDRDTKAFL